MNCFWNNPKLMAVFTQLNLSEERINEMANSNNWVHFQSDIASVISGSLNPLGLKEKWGV